MEVFTFWLIKHFYLFQLHVKMEVRSSHIDTLSIYKSKVTCYKYFKNLTCVLKMLKFPVCIHRELKDGATLNTHL